MTEEANWTEIWIELQTAAASLPRCGDHKEFAAIETLDLNVVNDILEVGPAGMRLRSHKTMNERFLPEKEFRKWWRAMRRDGFAESRPGDSPTATNSVIYAAFFVRCLPDRVSRRPNGHLELINNHIDPAVSAAAGLSADDPIFAHKADATAFVTRAILVRRGQQSFRESLIKRYGAQCMMTGCSILDIIEAAHIEPYREPKDHDPRNGLLLRADIHTLFDLHLIAVTDSYEIQLHPKVQHEYGPIVGRSLLFGETSNRPSRASLVARSRRRW